MSKIRYYVQCFLRRPINTGHKIDVAWIPERFARVGRWVKIKIDGIWEDGWCIMATYSKKRVELVEAKERDYLKQRKNSDV